ncbi:uncharacterized protein LOC128240006 [Mya arenaria]|uniref:uncharacterized protein LOC128240006 n=1 Tax=Mya arenaria TaxID=6604 RepID=UPI0022E14553|nr:uncharacterized protein LOC128240006 [Mya arenaria]
MSRIFTFCMLAIVIQVSQAASLKFEKESIQITTDAQGPSFICKKGVCKLCANPSKTDTVCIVATDRGRKIRIKLTLNDKALVEGDITGPGTRSICSRKNPLPNIDQICIIPKDVDIAKLHSCLDVSIKVNETTYRQSIGCFTIPKKNFLDRIVGEDDIPIKAISSLYGFNDSPKVVDDNIDGGTICHKGICRICEYNQTVCVIAKALHNAMTVELVSNRFVIVKGKITNNTDVSFCKKYLDARTFCIVARNINVKTLSACVNLTVQMKDKIFNALDIQRIGCFKIPNNVDEMQTYGALDSDDINVEPDNIDSKIIDAVADSFGSDDEHVEFDTVELDAFSPFGAEDNVPTTRLQKLMLTFLKSLQQQTVL